MSIFSRIKKALSPKSEKPSGTDITVTVAETTTIQRGRDVAVSDFVPLFQNSSRLTVAEVAEKMESLELYMQWHGDVARRLVGISESSRPTSNNTWYITNVGPVGVWVFYIDDTGVTWKSCASTPCFYVIPSLAIRRQTRRENEYFTIISPGTLPNFTNAELRAARNNA